MTQMSASDSSPKKRIVSTSRYGSGSAATALAQAFASLCLEGVAGRVAGARQGRHQDVVEGGRERHLSPRRGSTTPAVARRDADQPGTRSAVAAVAGQGSVGEHEGLLRGVLGVLDPAQDPVARPEDAGCLEVDEGAEGILVPCREGHGKSKVIHESPETAACR